MKIHKVSGSEALSFSGCEAKWMFAFHPGFHLESKKIGPAITRGNIGHAALEVFFKEFMNTSSVDKAKETTTSHLTNEMIKDLSTGEAIRASLVGEVVTILDLYFESDTFKHFISNTHIMGSEYSMEMYVTDEIILPGRVDLLVYWTAGLEKGEVQPIDFKFVYNFWTENDFFYNSQIPTYVQLGKINYPHEVVRRGGIMQFRHRKDAVERFKLTGIKPSKPDIAGIMDNHIKISQKIVELKELPVEEARTKVTRTLSKYTCSNCSFLRLCKADLNGGDTTEIIKYDYQPNSYGYDNMDEE